MRRGAETFAGKQFAMGVLVDATVLTLLRDCSPPFYIPFQCMPLIKVGGYAQKNFKISLSLSHVGRKAAKHVGVKSLKGVDRELRKSEDATHFATDGPAPRR